jgi:hypothetical protein
LSQPHSFPSTDLIFYILDAYSKGVEVLAFGEGRNSGLDHVAHLRDVSFGGLQRGEALTVRIDGCAVRLGVEQEAADKAVVFCRLIVDGDYL